METEQVTKLVDAIILLRDAIMYHANVIGYKTDDLNVGPDGKAKVELQLTIPPDNQTTEIDVTRIESEKTYTFEEIKAALNAMARKYGKTKALDLAKKYNPDGDIKLIPEEQYGSLMREAQDGRA